MKTYSPFHVDPRTKPDLAKPQDYTPPSDQELVRYVELYWREFHSTLKTYFTGLSARSDSLESTIVRIGPNGVLLFHKVAEATSIRVLDVDSFDPPLESYNVFEIEKRLSPSFYSFNFAFKQYSESEALQDGLSHALKEALGHFWSHLKPDLFEQMCLELLQLEGVVLQQDTAQDSKIDAIGKVYLDEPGRFLREETWGVECKHSAVERVSVGAIRQAETLLRVEPTQFDAICIMSSDDMTSIGRAVAINNQRVRVWDRPVLDNLLHRYPETLRRYFQTYAAAIDQLTPRKPEAYPYRLQSRLQGCPPGIENFRTYEDIGTEFIRTVFPQDLGPPRSQARTEDGVERRDVVCRNNRSKRFFERIASKFAADFVIWDFKNYAEPVETKVVHEVSHYANAALGRFIVVVSRMGIADSARKAQLRRLKNDDLMVLVVSDQHLMEMARRKEAGDPPEDVLEDLFDELITLY